jgi:hypothetical protein
MNLKFMGYMTVILVIIIIGLVIYLFRKIYADKEDPEDSSILENYMPQYAEGYTDGVIDTEEMGDERVKITFYPRDIDYIRLKKKLGIIKPLTIIYEKKFMEHFAKGELSGHRSKVKGYPNDINLLPEGIKNKESGKALMDFIQSKKKQEDEIEVLESRTKNMKKILDKTSGFEIVEDYAEKMSEMYEDLRKENIPPTKEPDKT